MKRTIALLSIVFTFFLIVSTIPAIGQQEEIVEKVSVEWWVIPVFAVDSTGKSITDLKETDIQLKVNNKIIPTFTLIKKNFTTSETPDAGQTKTPQTPPPPNIQNRTRNVFLLFDTALSTKESTQKAKDIAKRIVSEARKNTRFFIMTIEPFAGLAYAGGQTGDKKKLLDIIEKGVKSKPNSRVPDINEIIVETGGKFTKYDANDKRFLRTSIGKYYKRKSKNFVRSFESLYYALNAIKDNKFVYLFTEGISNAVLDTDSGNRSEYDRYLAEMAKYLGRSGAVLFIINPYGVVAPENALTSGEDSLRTLAMKSGGKYLEGQNDSIIEKIEHLHQAYYEIFFPASLKAGQHTLNIHIDSKRKGTNVHTMQAAEKNRTYRQMSDMEREVLALNLISGNPLYKTDLESEKANIKKVSKKKAKVTYFVEIPAKMLKHPLDLYRVRLNKKGTGTSIDKQAIRSAQPQLKIVFGKVKPDEDTYFALIDGLQKIALLHGVEKEDQTVFKVSLPPDPESQWDARDTIEKDIETRKPKDTEELNRLLEGAAQYCENLKDAAFHYICKEKITENQKPLRRNRAITKDIGNPGYNLYRKPLDYIERQDIRTTINRKHVFNYRLIKAGKQVKEERDLLKELKETNKHKKKSSANPDTTAEALRGIRFVSSKAVFGPITLLDKERQANYHFRLKGFKNMKEHRTAIIEAYPKNEKDSQFIYGKFWIDAENFSVLKIEANPNSIVGHSRLKKLADELNTRLFLTLETEFFKFRQGIRFPTRIIFKEKYKGGPLINSQRGTKGWTRTQTLTEYTDYMFFKVDMDVIYKK
jgi:VWFA-related protein